MITDFIGKTLIEIVNNNEEVIFTFSDKTKYKMYHQQDCCETVYLEEVIGDWDNILNSEIIIAKEDTNRDEAAYESTTWTFYEIRTIKGFVTLRWYGSSNGYYSESISVIQIAKPLVY
jgi:hypothetical protein